MSSNRGNNSAALGAGRGLDLLRIKVQALAERKSLSNLDDILVDPDAAPATPPDDFTASTIAEAARAVRAARARGASVMLIYGAHLLRNGAAMIVERMLARNWITHLATNGAGIIHDWEFAYLGRSTEGVRANVANGSFGAWDETGRNIHLALLAGALDGKGFGASLGKFVAEDGCVLPSVNELTSALREKPEHPGSPARAELLQAMLVHKLPGGRITVKHPRKKNCVLAHAFNHQVGYSVHPGIGYDIISNHPMFNGAVLGRAAQTDYALFGAAVDGLDGGVVLSIGSAIMGPQVFEKSMSCVNNLRIQDGRGIVAGHRIFIVDLQDGGNWDWTKGEPPKTNPAYYLRFCKSYARMGGLASYNCCDNVVFLHNLHKELERSP